MIQPTPAPAAPANGSQISPASGSFITTPQVTPESAFRFELGTDTPLVDKLAQEIKQLRNIPADDPNWQARIDEVLEALHAHEQGNKEAPARLMETVSQLWQRQPQEPVAMAQMQQFLSSLQKTLAEHPKSEPLISQIRGMQEMRPAPLRQGAVLSAGDLQNQAGKIANGAPLAPLQAQALLTQPQIDSQLLSLLSTATLNGEQLNELTAQAQLRQAQPQLPVATGALSRPMSGTSGHEFSPLTLDKQPSMWAEQMLAPLAERLRVQSHLGVKQATLRLDPPDLGKLNLQVRTEDDRVFIQISATNPAVRDQLLQLTDRLRQDLLFGQSYSQVDVEIGQHGEQTANPQNDESEQRIVQAVEDHEEPETRSLRATSDYHLDTYV